MRPALYGIRYSPWSRKAKWALEANHVDFEYREYLAMLGEPGLRLKSGRFFGRLSVPVLIKSDGNLFDSFEIAKWADKQGSAELFPKGREEEVAGWNEWAELTASAGRARTTATVAKDPAALLDSIPTPLRGLGPITTALGKSGAHFILVKYGRVDLDAVQEELRGRLQRIRATLERTPFLLGDRITYADMTMALALQFVSPVPDDVIHIGVKSRGHWADPVLAAEFEDVFAWRDRVFSERPT
ncbi:MAG: glutathione S-transferase [Bradymonadia bacterium]|jgi:glutathione S-transferase